MRIALLSDGIFPYKAGGIQKHSYYLAKYLARKSIFVHIICPDISDDFKSNFSTQEFRYISYQTVKAPYTRKYPGHYIRECYLLSKSIFLSINNWNQFSFVYAQGFTGWYYAINKQKKTDLPLLVTNFHGLNMFQKAATFKEQIKQYLFKYPVKNASRSSDINCSLGGKLTPILEKFLSSDKIIETPIGISEDWVVKKDDLKTNELRTFIFIGRYERTKGIEELSEVIGRLCDLYDFRFHFIGPIKLSDQVRSDKISYHGFVKNTEEIKQFLLNSDCLVCPSYSEGMPTVILEAMASGCAIIASDVGAICEEVDSSNGFLIEAGNIQQLEKVIINFLNISEKEIYKMKSHSIRKVSEKFLWPQTIDITLDKINFKLKENNSNFGQA